ncbi:MAG: pyridoxal-phosphate dependent enzyme [Halobacteriales archaeon]|nr:pyridoxal-phosphate dependent enzyme [Halobacteriales archaeon]
MTTLRCSVCDSEYDSGPTEPWRCTCGGPLDFAEAPRPDGSAPDPTALDTRAGLWAFSDFLPITPRVTLGEGFTPLVEANDWNAQFKLEWVFPSGSFKDRGATALLSRAAELGVDRVVDDSSGNAGAAIAQYAAVADIPAEIYVPAGVKQAKLRAIERAGAEPIRIEGSREDVTAACIDRVESGDAWYASHAWNPAFFAGTSTFAMEVCAQRDWEPPEAVVSPLGHGTLFLGAYRGFQTLKDAGWIDRLPRMLGAQAAGYAPIVAELHGESAAAGTNDVADGIQIREPARKAQIITAIEATDGDAIAVSEAAVDAALDRLHRGGYYTEPTCAAAPAALEEYRERGVLAADADVVVPLTGSGLKSE